MNRDNLGALVLVMACSALIPAGLAAGCSPSSGAPGAGSTFDSGSLDATFGDDSAADGSGLPSLTACLSGVASSAVPSRCAPLVQCLESTCETELTTCFGAVTRAGTSRANARASRPARPRAGAPPRRE